MAMTITPMKVQVPPRRAQGARPDATVHYERAEELADDLRRFFRPLRKQA